MTINDLPAGVIMSETTPDFRKGFEFAVKCIFDQVTHRPSYTYDQLKEMLGTIVMLMDKDCWWHDVKTVIIRE